MKSGRPLSLACILVPLFVLLLTDSLPGQTSSGTLRGRVTDPTGAVIPQATITATGANGQKTTAVTDNQGAYELKGLSPGNYTVSTAAKGFAVSTEQNVAISAAQVQQFDIALEIQVQPEKVEVQEESATVGVNPSENASSIVIKGKDLEALSDDPDELQQELDALAGPSAGPNGGQIYIDGFTAGQLPPKSSIREIRINQNPFSAEYDKLGYGRIEIFTKPGTDQFHGQFMLDGNSSAFDALSPFASNQPSFHSELFNGSVSGPLSKKASFFFTAQVREINDSNIVTAVVPLSTDLSPQSPNFEQAVPNPETRINVGPRLDFQLTPSNTLTVRYQFYRNSEDNQGVGQFSLPSQAYNTSSTEHTLQISDTQVVSTNVVNETRFQYLHDSSNQALVPMPTKEDPCAQLNFHATVSVLGAFTCGGNQIGNGSDLQNHYELQNYTSIVHGNHLIKFGGRLRAMTDSNVSNSNFKGVFTFSSLSKTSGYEKNPLGGAACLAPFIAALPALPTSGDLFGCGGSQFAITTGQPLSDVSLVDAGLYAQDDWRIRPNMTLSYGLRFETQNDIHDHGDFAPRISFAWGLGGGKKVAPKTVLRAGFGMFYERFPYNLVLQAERLNGFTQQQTIVAAMQENSPTSYQIASNLRAPLIMQSAVGVERQVAKSTTVALTYINSYGEHQLFLRNANAPLPGTPDIRPFGGNDNIYQYDSEGIFRQNQLIANFRTNLGTKLSLFGFYMLNYANSDLGAGSGGGGGFGSSGGSGLSANFLSNSYDPMADYGRSSFDVHHRVVVGGTVSMPYAIRLNPFIIVSSGQPYNVTVGQDLNGDSIFNDRPALASTATCSVLQISSTTACTQLGTFNLAPAPGQAIPINLGTGPTLFTMNLRLSKTFGFGREVGAGQGPRGGQGGGGGGRGGAPGGGLGGRGLSGGGGPGGPFSAAAATNRRYNLTFSVSARNVLNRVNLAPPIGNLDSPLFGESNALAGGPYSFGSATRRIDLQVLFSF